MSNSFFRPKKVALCTVVLFGFTSIAMAPAVAQDTTASAPTLESFTVTSDAINAAAGGDVTATIVASDDTALEKPEVEILNAAGNAYGTAEVELTEGDAKDGTWTATATIAPDADVTPAELGQWEVSLAPLVDEDNQSTNTKEERPFTYALAPENPTDVVITTSTVANMSASWTAPESNGSAVEKYVGTILDSSGAKITSFETESATCDTCSLEITPDQVEALKFDETYTLSIVAVNAVGTSSATTAEFNFAKAPLTDPVPTISGPLYVGETLTADAGDWGPEPVELAYQWLRDNKSIVGATDPTYTLVEEDEGTNIRVEVEGTKAGYNTSSAISEATLKIEPADSAAPEVTASLPAGNHVKGSEIVLSSNEDAKIYYTTDGTEPTQDSTLYTEPIVINGKIDLKYIAVDGAGNVSEPAGGTYSLDFTDVSPCTEGQEGTKYYDEIRWLVDEGITTGWKDGTFRPYEDINRDAMAAFLYRMAGSPEFTAPEESPFVDYDADNKYYKQVTWLEDQGITTGWVDKDAGTAQFRAFSDINRDAVAAFLYRMADKPEFTAPEESPFVDYDADNKYYKQVTWLEDQGITTGWVDKDAGTAEFRALADINRDAMAAFLYRLAGQGTAPQ